MKDDCKVQEADGGDAIFQVGNACVIVKGPNPLPDGNTAQAVIGQWHEAGWDILREKHLR